MASANAAAAAADTNPGDLTEFTLSSTDQEGNSDTNSSPQRHRRGVDSQQQQQQQAPMDRRALIHELQLAKIELSQRNAELQDGREQWRSREEDLCDRLSNLERENTQLKHQLQQELDQLRTESRRRHERSRRCLDEALGKQRELEEANANLIDRAGDIKRMLHGNLLISDELAQQLTAKSDNEINVRDYVCVRVYETVQPLVQQIEELRARAQLLTSERDSLLQELDGTRDCLQSERELHLALQEAHQKISAELSEVRTQVHSGNYKVAHFDEIQSERDRARSQLEELHKTSLQLQSQLEATSKERDQLKRDSNNHQQAASLLKQDCAYLGKQVNELASRAAYAEERCQSTQTQLDEARQAKDSAIEKAMAERERWRAELEAKTQRELERLRLGSESEVDRLRRANSEFYETQLRAHKEQRERAVVDCERAIAKQQEAELRLQELQDQLAKLHTSGSAQVNELQADMRLKEFELDRSTLLLTETQAKLEEALLENKRLQAKLQLAQGECSRLEQLNDRQAAEHDIIVSGLNARLQGYEAAEAELDGVVLQAAEMAQDADAEQIVSAFGSNVTVPATANRRMRQSVQLARRVLQLERQLRDATNESERQRQLAERSRSELNRLEAVMEDAEQPYGYLVDSLRNRDQRIDELTEALDLAEQKLRSLIDERNRLAEAKNRMAADLERLIGQREELASLKQVVAELRQQQQQRGKKTIGTNANAGQQQQQIKHKPYALHFS